MWDLYVEKRLSVFPVTPLTKTPEVKWTEYRARMPKKEEIEKWKKENHNVGIVCGAISDNLVVVDFDNPELFELVFPNVRGKTWVVRTPRPGVHVYFRTDKPIRSRNYNFAKIQVKGDGGYVLAPPSIHPNGNRYEFMEDSSPDKCDIAVVKSDDFFQKLEERLRELGFKIDFKEEVSETEEQTISDPPWVRKILDGVQEGMRDECAIRLASYYCNVKHMAPQAVEAILLNWNQRNKPPVGDAEKWVRTKVMSAIRGGYVYTRHDPLVRQFSDVPEEHEVEKIINNIMSSDAVDFILNHLEKVVKHDRDTALILLLAFGTSFTRRPVNVFLRGPPSIGKTHITKNVASYFPNALLLMGMSPKTIVHEYSAYSREDDAYIVDLWHKILIFLEEPSNAVYEMLRPLMSQDSETVVYKWVEQKKNRQRTVKAIIKGWPVFVFLGTTAKLLEDLASRGIHATPNMSENKWDAAMFLKGLMFSKPFEFIYEDDLTFKAIKEYLNRVLEYSKVKQLDVVIPYAIKIVKVLKSSKFPLIPRSARDISILFGLIVGSAVLNVFRRPIIRIHGSNSWHNYVVATAEDMKNAMSIWLSNLPASLAGVTQAQYELYKLFDDFTLDVSNELTVKYIHIKWNEKYPDKPLSAETLRKYLSVLEDRGLLVSDKNDKGRVVYSKIDMRTLQVEALSIVETYFDENDLNEWLNSLNSKEAYFVVDGVVFDAKNLTEAQKNKIMGHIVNGVKT